MHAHVSSATPATARPPRRSQADRRAESHAALLSSAAQALSRYGYGKLNLGDVAAEAGYTRGALYHLFADKEDLALAVVAWAWETWQQQVGSSVDPNGEPFQTLVALAADAQGRSPLDPRLGPSRRHTSRQSRDSPSGSPDAHPTTRRWSSAWS
jgi:AcrR family transcriptional regulator